MYPISLNLTDKPCTVVGGGKVAERKVKTILASGGRVQIISPFITEGLQTMVQKGDCSWLQRNYQPGDLEGAFLVFAATDMAEVQEQVRAEAEKEAILFNSATDPQNSSFHVPALVRKGDLSLAVFTGGHSPALAAMIKDELANDYGDNFSRLLTILSDIRKVILAQVPCQKERKKIFRELLHPEILSWTKQGCWQKINAHFIQVLGNMAEDIDFLDKSR